jgi:hypothetical protein
VNKNSPESPLEHPEETLEQKINRETARIHWKELETHFAAGQLISVAPELDLISVAKAMTNNDTVAIKEWMDTRQVTPTSDTQAAEWQAYNAELWAAVIKPWVLVQTVSANKTK